MREMKDKQLKKPILDSIYIADRNQNPEKQISDVEDNKIVKGKTQEFKKDRMHENDPRKDVVVEW